MTKTHAVVFSMIVGTSVWLGLAARAADAAQPRPTVAGACHEVPEAESHLAVLLSPDDVLRVEVLGRREHLDDPTVPLGDGARIVIAAQPFVTGAWLESAIECHLARSAASGGAVSRSPLDVGGARISVSTAPGTLSVNITSDDPRAAREILERARALAPPPASPSK